MHKIRLKPQINLICGFIYSTLQARCRAYSMISGLSYLQHNVLFLKQFSQILIQHQNNQSLSRCGLENRLSQFLGQQKFRKNE